MVRFWTQPHQGGIHARPSVDEAVIGFFFITALLVRCVFMLHQMQPPAIIIALRAMGGGVLLGSYFHVMIFLQHVRPSDVRI